MLQFALIVEYQLQRQDIQKKRPNAMLMDVTKYILGQKNTEGGAVDIIKAIWI